VEARTAAHGADLAFPGQGNDAVTSLASPPDRVIPRYPSPLH